jgi:hypothetical protein
MLSRFTLPALLSTLLTVAACGGGGSGLGGSGGGTPPTVTRTTGQVASVDGQTADLSGVGILATTTGAATTTGLDGRFDLGLLPAGPNQLWVTPPATPRAFAASAPIEITIDTSGSGRLELRLEIEDGVIRRLDLDLCDGEHGEEIRAALTAVEPGLSGKVEVKHDDDGDQEFEVEAEHLIPGRIVEIVVIDPATGAEETLGLFAAGDDGEAEVELESEDGARLPFGVTDLADLAGFGVEVRDGATDALLLEGQVPALGDVGSTCPDDDHAGPDDDGGDDDHSGSSGSGSSGSGGGDDDGTPDQGSGDA